MRTRQTLAHSLFILLALALMSAPGCAKKKAPPPSPTSEPTTTSQQPDETGTTETTPAQTEEIFAARDIYFDYDRAVIRDDARPALTSLGKHLMDNPTVRVQIEGHCDERGTTEYNLALGERRAKAARDWLVAYGVGDDRLSTISYGKERPVDPGHTEAAYSKNRRAHFNLQGA